ncbi:GNAT family N-acetyltransferase [Pyxidicoccus sp. MSG2]|nr:GNAT family N-acetyltransferase [Pyxidicoccus sp. MSG2]MCY1016133.1 GNAT family N-acetyltransferase [Pyxidicoccus sp. MSG2]
MAHARAFAKMGAMAPVTFRIATVADLPTILALLADDAIARSRTGYLAEPTPAVRAAFDEISAASDNELIVGELAGEVIATLQLTYIPGLSRGGMRRALVEAVRVRADLRGQRIGEQLMEDAMARARARGCGLMQLTTDKRRTDAHRFYARLGFEASHEGMKRAL